MPGIGGIFLQLFSQPHHMGVHGPGDREAFMPPDLVQDQAQGRFFIVDRNDSYLFHLSRVARRASERLR